MGEKGNVVAAAQATAQDTLGRVTTTVTGVAVETVTMAGDTLRDKAIEKSVDHPAKNRTHKARHPSTDDCFDRACSSQQPSPSCSPY